ncbi:hypothetical protein AFCDBAGC_1542 [Methylobacterium cerastii]|uniref:Uncharacterized protein n=1 Tax=Methylobacterium cerastii TaxID=932741 RepID=A0ABQ4QFS5_9HYPH|nr:MULTISPECIES: hypothetical protein [Methylobacterium]TXM69168.1 hypothetical protein FV229_05870 [Methylobacterium sp. WL120]TXN81056.1 hypothetical protein FV234_14900 [Methylobacterium sp. WL8]GJD43690.1 hypothetical protein AFCDBAGC_1542 [Methylobacterium cerastii]
MRSWKFLMVVLALLGGATGLSLSAKAAPMSVPIAAAQSDAEPLVQTARWHGRRHWHRHHWHRHHRWHRHHHWRRHHHHRHHFGHHRRLRFY